MTEPFQSIDVWERKTTIKVTYITYMCTKINFAATKILIDSLHCVKSVSIWSFSGLHSV